MRKTACPVVWEGGGAQSPSIDPIARPTSLHRTRYRAPSLRTPCGAIVRVPDGLGVGRRSIYTTALHTIHLGNFCPPERMPWNYRETLELAGGGSGVCLVEYDESHGIGTDCGGSLGHPA